MSVLVTIKPLQIPLSAATYPVWSVTVNLPANTLFDYKFIRKETDGSVSQPFSLHMRDLLKHGHLPRLFGNPTPTESQRLYPLVQRQLLLPGGNYTQYDY